MDKNEYKICADEIRALIKEKQYKEAVELADTINWKNVVNAGMLCTISDLYKICKRFEDSRDVLYLAYQRNPSGRMILYSLCELSIKLGDVVNAVEYYKEFVQVAPKDSGKYVLKYKLYTAQEVGLDERIAVLEELQQYECKEKWMYELAYLYHMNGYGEKCVEECNQIVIYFGEGKYVIKALELKALHEPLSYEQDNLYKRLTSPKENEILVKEMDVSKYNTIDLQKELANSMAEVWFDDTQAKEALEAEREAAKKEAEAAIRAEQERKAAEEAMRVAEAERLEREKREAEKAKAEENLSKQESSEDDGVVEFKKMDFLGETKVFNVREIEESLKKEAISRTVVPNRGFDEMREVMPRSVENSAIVFRSYDDMVSMEGDGQISFNVPEQEVIDKQITGQISIADVMAEFERMKNASEKKWRDDMRRKVIQQTNVIFKDFDENAKNGYLEELESQVIESPRVELTKEEEEALIGENLMPITAEEEEPDEILFDDTKPLNHHFEDDESDSDTAPSIEVVPAMNIPVSNPAEIIHIKEPEVMQEEDTAPSHDVHEIIIEETEDETPEEDPTPEELFFDRTPFVEEREIETMTDSEVSGPEPEAEDNTAILPKRDEIDDYFMRFAEAGEERDRLDAMANFETQSYEADENTVEEITEDIEEEVIGEIENIEEEVIEETEESTEEVIEETEENTEEVIEETEECEKEIAEEPEVVEEGEPETGVSGLTLEQEERFESFIQSEEGLSDIKDAIGKISMEAGKGNAFIGSEDSDSSVELAIALIKELFTREGPGIKVGKTKASSLNAKSADALEETLTKQYGCAVIVQDANELRPETLAVIEKVLNTPNERMFMAFTSTSRGKHKFLMNNGGILPNFDISIDIEAMSDKELAAYARAYAYRKEFSIDEMGMLALHTRIEEKQSNNHCVTVTEVKGIIDEAIAKATKKSPKHFIATLVGNRYDDNDMIVLKEKDFAKGRE